MFPVWGSVRFGASVVFKFRVLFPRVGCSGSRVWGKVWGFTDLEGFDL